MIEFAKLGFLEAKVVEQTSGIDRQDHRVYSLRSSRDTNRAIIELFEA